MALVHSNITITGRVQGVGFRAAAWQAAQRLGIKGFVCNLDDGNVYAEAEGEPGVVQEFLKWCKLGPATSRVEVVTSSEDLVVNYSSFEIRRKH